MSHHRRAITAEGAPHAVGPYSHAVVSSGIVFCSGQVPLDPQTGSLVEGSIGDRTRRCLEHLSIVAQAAAASVGRRTPVLSSRTISERAGGLVALKAENLQRTGSFKVRGAGSKLAALGASGREAGVVAASAGNHAQGLAAAAAAYHVRC